MKIKYLTHSCVIVEVNNKTILMDPWLSGPCWGGNIWHYPPPVTKPSDLKDIDYIYFSHAHDDHLHKESIDLLPKEIFNCEIIIPNFGVKYFSKTLESYGFKNITEYTEKDDINIDDNTKLKIFINDVGDHDSSLLIKDNKSSKNIFFQTDNLMSVDEAQRIGKNYNIDVLFNITVLTGIYPAFYCFDINQVKKLADKKVDSGFDYSIQIANAINPKYVVPYASDLCYLGDLFFANNLHRVDKNKFKDATDKNNCKFETKIMGPEDEIIVNQNEIKFNLKEHDFEGENLSAYASSMRKEVSKRYIEETKYEDKNLSDDINLFINSLNNLANKWSSGNFKVLWNIISIDGTNTYIGQNLPFNAEFVEEDWDYDLWIEVPSYRLQRLINKDYAMGILTFQNGSIRCKRVKSNFSDTEKNFWDWTMQLRF
tara:strand:- start:14515 stop:15795 length:1281 start_codon:yes stop_codon:yes gene_type:complete